MKKAVIGIIAVVLLVAVFSAAANPRWGYTRYGVYNYAPYDYGYGPSPYYLSSPYYSYPAYPYSYYRSYNYPSYSSPYYYNYPAYSSPYYYNYPAYTSPYTSPQYNYPYSYGPLSSEYMYRYGAPQVSTPAYVSAETPRGAEGQLCGVVDSKQFGCVSGLVCDYTKGAQKGVGVCSYQSEGSSQLPSSNYQYNYGMYS